MRQLRIALLLSCVVLITLTAESQALFTATLTGGQQVPPVSTTGRGTAWAILDMSTKTLSYRFTFARLSGPATGGHFHVLINGDPIDVFPFAVTGNTVAGTWANLPDSTVRHLLRNEILVNVHTSLNPGGEIAGILRLAPGAGFTVSMDPSQEIPPTTSGGLGTGYVVLDSAGGRISWDLTVAGLTDTLKSGHFHAASSSAVVKPITFVDSTSSGTWTGFVDSILTAAIKGGLYMNVHTKTYPGGELRGAVTPVGPLVFAAPMTGDQETPPVVTNGRGTVWAVLSADKHSIAYRLTYARLNAARTIAHFHAAGSGGGNVVFPFSFAGNTAAGTWSNPADSVLRHLYRGEIYANIHSGSSPGGEIRGYLHLVSGIGFTVAMDAAQEVPSNSSTGLGTGYVALDSAGRKISWDLTVAGLTDTLKSGHFHAASSSAVVKPITFVDSTSSGAWTGYADSILTAIVNTGLYMNVHTKTYPGGELRGPVRFSNSQVTGIAVNAPETPNRFRIEQNYPNPFNPSTTIRYELATGTRVKLTVYNMLGQEVATLADQDQPAGVYEVRFDAGRLSSGVYFYRLRAATGESAIGKMLLLK